MMMACFNDAKMSGSALALITATVAAFSTRLLEVAGARNKQHSASIYSCLYPSYAEKTIKHLEGKITTSLQNLCDDTVANCFLSAVVLCSLVQ
jgi:hypothetical protein